MARESHRWTDKLGNYGEAIVECGHCGYYANYNGLNPPCFEDLGEKQQWEDEHPVKHPESPLIARDLSYTERERFKEAASEQWQQLQENIAEILEHDETTPF